MHAPFRPRRRYRQVGRSASGAGISAEKAPALNAQDWSFRVDLTCRQLSLCNGKISYSNTPITQWIERYPLEAEACMRVAVGVPTKTHPEHHQIGVEQFLEMLRFDQRSKLEESPGIRK